MRRLTTCLPHVMQCAGSGTCSPCQRHQSNGAVQRSKQSGSRLSLLFIQPLQSFIILYGNIPQLIPASPPTDSNSADDMPRIIRRQSTYQRISSYLNPFDFLLRLATDYEAFDWDNWQNTWGTPLGIVLNVSCMISRSHAEKFRRASVDDVFRRTSGSPSMAAGLSYFVCDTSDVSAATAEKTMACRPLSVDNGSCSYFTFVDEQLWLSSLALAAFSVGNAIYCFTRKKRYRLFESSIEV
jgi:hypothetical protein